MSHRQPYTSDIPPYVGETGDVAELQEGEEDEVMEEVADEQGYGEYFSLNIHPARMHVAVNAERPLSVRCSACPNVR